MMTLSDEAVAALARAIGIDAREIARRKEFLEFDETDVSLLTELHARLQDVSRRFVDDFYAHLLQFEETRRFISDPQVLERLKQSQAAYFDSLTAGDYGPEYILRRLRVGVAHQRIGLEPKWYIGAYSKYLVGLLPDLWRLLGGDPDKFLATYHALQKIVFLDMGLALDTYIQADRRAILDLKRYAEDIIASLPAGLVVVDDALKVHSVNRSLREMFGLKNGEDVSGRDLEDLLPLPDLRRQAQAVLTSGIALHGIDATLDEKQLRLTITGVRLAEEARLLMVVEDITERKRAEDLLARLGRILDNSSNEIYVFDAATLHFVQVNQGARRNLGYTLEELKTLTPLDIKPLFTRQSFEDMIAPLRHGERDMITFETVHKRKDGGLYPVEIRLHISRTETRPVFAAIIQDITERRRAEEWRQHYTRTLDLLTAGAPLGEALEGIAMFVERECEGALCSILLLSVDGKRLLHGAAPSLPEFYNRAIDGIEIGEGAGSCGTAAFTGHTVVVEDVLTHPYWTSYRELATRAGLRACWSEPVLSAGNKVLGTFALYYREPRAPAAEDIEIIRQGARLAALAIDRARRQEELRLAAVVFEQSAEAVVITDTGRRVLTANRAFTQMTGYAREEVIGNTLSILKSGRHDAAFFRKMWEHVGKDGHWQGEVWNRRKSGEIHPVWMSLAAVRNEKGVITHHIGIMTDIAERKTQAARIEQLAFYDPLTGLPNRALLVDRLNQALSDAERHGQRVAILFMDINRFKEINDIMGHDVGDQVLAEVARRFQGVLRQADTIARFGGDEFVIIARESDQSSTVQIAERLQQALGDPIAVKGRSFSVGASIGIAFYPEDGKSSDELLKQADIAMYRAKASGGGYRFYRPEMSAGLAKRLELAGRLGRALEAGQLQLYYQPIVNLQTKVISGAEALLRWNDPEQGWVSPAEFIPIAEERGMMRAIGKWVLQETCRQLKAWQETGLNFPGQLAINIAAQQLEEAEFVGKTRVIVRAAGLMPDCLALELTESGLMANTERVIGMMEALKTAGFALSIDDFGTGYSSLTYLKHLPVDKLKIDISFVRDMLKDSNDYTIVAAIIAMARTLGLRTVAEGVEEAAQAEALQALGCDEAQGYYFGRPDPAEVFAQKWLKTTA